VAHARRRCGPCNGPLRSRVKPGNRELSVGARKAV
jgi:hypothetical protein